MNPQKRVRGTLLLFLVVTSLLLGGASGAPNQNAQAWGEAVDGLQMVIYLDQAETAPSKPPKFRLALHNVAQDDLIVNLGIMLANGKKQFPRAIILTITDAQGKSRQFDLREPGFVAGRMDPMVLPLPAGSVFSVPVDLDNYWAAASREFDYKLKPGTYFLEAQFTGRGVSQQEANLDVKGIALMPYWVGTVMSNRLQFTVPST